MARRAPRTYESGRGGLLLPPKDAMVGGYSCLCSDAIILCYQQRKSCLLLVVVVMEVVEWWLEGDRVKVGVAGCLRSQGFVGPCSVGQAGLDVDSTSRVLRARAQEGGEGGRPLMRGRPAAGKMTAWTPRRTRGCIVILRTNLGRTPKADVSMFGLAFGSAFGERENGGALRTVLIGDPGGLRRGGGEEMFAVGMKSDSKVRSRILL